MPTLRLGCAQLSSETGDLSGNIARAIDILEPAGCRVVVFPELYLCGYDPDWLGRHPDAFLPEQRSGQLLDPRLRPLTAFAHRTGTVVICGAATTDTDGQPRNSLVCFAGQPAPRVVYHKQYLWDAEERAVFRPSTAHALLQVDGWRLALSICYDCSFPEHARQGALSGADVYLTSAAFLAGREYRGRIYHAARALENTIFSAFVNYSGERPGSGFTGGTVIFGPDGRQVTEAAGGGSGIVVADLRSEHISETRAYLRMLQDCRTPAMEARSDPSGAGR